MPAMHWIGRFLGHHQARFAPHDWPEGDDLITWAESWAAALDRLGATEAEAEAASAWLVGDPPAFRRDHIPAVIRAIRRGRSSEIAPEPADSLTRADAERARAHAEWAQAEDAWHAIPADERDALMRRLLRGLPGMARWHRVAVTMCLAMHRGQYTPPDPPPPTPPPCKPVRRYRRPPATAQLDPTLPQGPNVPADGPAF